MILENASPERIKEWLQQAFLMTRTLRRTCDRPNCVSIITAWLLDCANLKLNLKNLNTVEKVGGNLHKTPGLLNFHLHNMGISKDITLKALHGE